MPARRPAPDAMDTEDAPLTAAEKFQALLRPSRTSRSRSASASTRRSRSASRSRRYVVAESGDEAINFAEAGLLVQGSAVVYGRKVDGLHGVVYKVLENLRTGKSPGGRRGPGRRGDEGRQASGEDEFGRRYDAGPLARVVDVTPGRPSTSRRQGRIERKKARAAPADPMVALLFRDVEEDAPFFGAAFGADGGLRLPGSRREAASRRGASARPARPSFDAPEEAEDAPDPYEEMDVFASDGAPAPRQDVARAETAGGQRGPAVGRRSRSRCVGAATSARDRGRRVAALEAAQGARPPRARPRSTSPRRPTRGWRALRQGGRRLEPAQRGGGGDDYDCDDAWAAGGIARLFADPEARGASARPATSPATGGGGGECFAWDDDGYDDRLGAAGSRRSEAYDAACKAHLGELGATSRPRGSRASRTVAAWQKLEPVLRAQETEREPFDMLAIGRDIVARLAAEAGDKAKTALGDFSFEDRSRDSLLVLWGVEGDMTKITTGFTGIAEINARAPSAGSTDTGAVARRFSTWDAFDVCATATYATLARNPDWTHLNAFDATLVGSALDALVVSSFYLGWIFAWDYSSGDVRWLLGACHADMPAACADHRNSFPLFVVDEGAAGAVPQRYDAGQHNVRVVAPERPSSWADVALVAFANGGRRDRGLDVPSRLVVWALPGDPPGDGGRRAREARPPEGDRVGRHVEAAMPELFADF
ncbi:hypothetical protein JL720_14214 [Aureococcus anophagefferens]|nr:hypothetical protein JL720_14214 [Aureococcus anophagefferens]